MGTDKYGAIPTQKTIAFSVNVGSLLSPAYGTRGRQTTGKRVTAAIAKTSPSLARKGGRGRRICGGRHAKHLLALFHTIAVRRGRQRRQPATPYKKVGWKNLGFFQRLQGVKPCRGCSRGEEPLENGETETYLISTSRKFSPEMSKSISAAHAASAGSRDIFSGV